MTNNKNSKNKSHNKENRKNDMGRPSPRRGTEENPKAFENFAGKPIE